LAWVLSIVAASMLADYYLERKIFPVMKTKVKSIFLGKELLQFSWPLTLVGVLNLVTGWAGTTMLGIFKTTKEVGIYSAALPTASMLGSILTGFSFIFMPIASELFSRNKIEELKSVFKTVTRWNFILTFPFFLVIFLFPHIVMRILFGPEFIASSLALSILALGYFSRAVIGPANLIILSLGKTKLILISNIVTAVSNFLLNLWLVPLYGVTGAAIAMTSSLILGDGLTFVFVYSLIRLQPYSPTYLKPILAGILAGGLIYFPSQILFVAVPVWFAVVGLILFLTLYFLFSLFFRSLEREDVMILKAIEEKAGINVEWLRNLIKKFI